MTDELRKRAEARIGTILRERYRIEALLGVGGMAVVYLATHRNKKRFAIKLLHSELAIREETKQRFIREGYLANTVDHPGAVSVIDDDVTEEGIPFIVMELLDGAEVGELAEKRGNTLPVPLVLAIADQVLTVLQAAHAKGVVHRDLKPANLFITRDGTVKVLDFGIARLRDAMAAGPSALTQTGALMGTPAFLPPEQAGGRTRDIDHQTDLWALGATMFTLLTGQYVHDAENATQIIIAAATQPARTLASVMPQAPHQVVQLVDRALAFDKAARWPDAATMRAATREAYRAVTHGNVPTREALAEMFGIGTWETKYGEILQPPPDEARPPNTTGPRGYVGTTPMPIGSRPALPTAPMPVPLGSGPMAATATPVARSVAFEGPPRRMNVLALVGIGSGIVGVVLIAVALLTHRTAQEVVVTGSADSRPVTSASLAPIIASSAPALTVPSATSSASAVAVASTVARPAPPQPSTAKSAAPCFIQYYENGETHFKPCTK